MVSSVDRNERTEAVVCLLLFLGNGMSGLGPNDLFLSFTLKFDTTGIKTLNQYTHEDGAGSQFVVFICRNKLSAAS